MLRLVVTGVCIAACAVGLAATPAAGTSRHGPDAVKRSGHWFLLDTSASVQSATPTVWKSGSGTAYVLWLRKPTSSRYTYDVSRIAASGKAGAPADIFKGSSWGSLSNEPTLVNQGKNPLVVFDGARGTSGPYSKGCAYGALGAKVPWKLQSWSLSHVCVNSVGPAGEGKNGQLAYAYVGSKGIAYRIGVSHMIPAAGLDKQINLNGGFPQKIGIAANTGGTGHWYVAWAQANSNKRDGLYAKDVTAHSANAKAPGSGTKSVAHLSGFFDLAIAARSAHSGIYLAYCSNSDTCSLRLWRVGAKSAMAIPHATPDPISPSISAGPAGRIWLAWYDNSTNRVYVVRTNKAVTRFSRVQSYATPCAENGLIGLSGGSSGRLDVGVQCFGSKQGHAIVIEGQTVVGLSASVGPGRVSNTSSHKVTVTVTDTGDAVAGATVRYGTQHPKTNNKGRATITIAKGTSVGKHVIRVTARDYAAAHTSVKVTH
jgi:hypothetical protein